MSAHRTSRRIWLAGLLMLGSVALLVVGTSAARGSEVAAMPVLGRPTGISLNEFMPNPEADWNGDGVLGDDNDEYIELYNSNDLAVDLSQWQIDNVEGAGSPYTLPTGTVLQGRGYLALWSRDTGLVLGNSGDGAVRLLAADGVVVDSYSYATSPADVAYSRSVDGAHQWTVSYPPSPGAPNQPLPWTETATPTLPTTLSPTPTLPATSSPTPSATALPSATPTSTPISSPTPYSPGIGLNEFMPNPEHVDWNGDGVLGDANDEYIELHNANDFAVDLSGWRVDDMAGGGSSPFTLPAGTTLEAQGFLALWSRETHIALNNSGGDFVRLLRPDGVEVESHGYTAAAVDVAASKSPDGGSQWTTAYPPSPGATNQPLSTPTPTPTATPGVYPDGVSLNEFMPDPASDWNGDGAINQNDEYVELYNANDFDVDVGGWRLDDVDDGIVTAPEGSPPFTLPPGMMIAADGFLLLFRTQTGIALNNDGDWVRLLNPDGVLVEAIQYRTSNNDQAYSKTVDGGAEWTRSYPPSPGSSNATAGTPTPSPSPWGTPTPGPAVIRLNELLPSPRSVDWDGNGTASYLDEWIEVVNLGNGPVDLGGWKLADGQGADHEPAGVYVFPANVVLQPRGYLVVFRAQSRLALNASDEMVRLLRPDNTVADSMRYDHFAGYDQSWCRLPDGSGEWSRYCLETPGRANQPDAGGGGDVGGSGASWPPYDRFAHDLVTVAHARSLADGTRLTLEGQVTVLPNVFDDQQIYVQDATGGMLVYVRSGEWPPLAEGQWVRVNGRLATFYGEREIALVRIDDIKAMQPAAPPAPLPIGTGAVGEAHEGQLVQIQGAVTGYWKETTLYLDDGSGEARISIRPATGIRRPYVVIGELWTMVGVVSQSESGYRLLPRSEADLQRGRAAAGRATAIVQANGAQDDSTWNTAPVFLPVTGATLLVWPPAPADLREAWYQIPWLLRSP